MSKIYPYFHNKAFFPQKWFLVWKAPIGWDQILPFSGIRPRGPGLFSAASSRRRADLSACRGWNASRLGLCTDKDLGWTGGGGRGETTVAFKYQSTIWGRSSEADVISLCRCFRGNRSIGDGRRWRWKRRSLAVTPARWRSKAQSPVWGCWCFSRLMEVESTEVLSLQFHWVEK